MAKRNAQPTEPQPLENLDAALSDVSSNAHAGETEVVPTPMSAPAENPPQKKPRTASPVQLASRAFQRMCDLQAQRAREAFRHTANMAKVNEAIADFNAECDKMDPEVRRFLDAMRAAAEVKS